MAFPTIQTADTKNGTVASNSASWTITYPTNLASGDLILLFLGADGAGAITTMPAGWIASGFQLGAVSISIAKKISNGTETGTFTTNLAGSEQGGWRCFRITGWEGTIGTTFDGSATDGAVTGPGSPGGGASQFPDPPDLDPANWGTEETLWFATCGVDTSRTISVYPLASNNSADVSGGSTGATLGVCSTNSAVGSLNPGTFTISASDDWGALTVAVRPAAASGTTYTKAGFGVESA